MKQLFVLLIAMSILSASELAGQCKMEIKGTLKIYEKKTNIDFEKGTNIEPFFSKFGIAGSAANYSFVETTGGEKMLMLIYLNKDVDKTFSINENTPLIMFLEGGEKVEVFTHTQVDATRKNPTSFYIIPCYILSKEQIEMLATNEVNSLRIYFKSESKVRGLLLDEIGKYLEIEIKKDKYKEDFASYASCISQE